MIIEARQDTITLRGRINSNIWPAVQAAAALLLENHPTGIIVDCFGLTKITPRGAETFADAFEYIRAHNARIVVVGLSPKLVEIGKMVPGVRSQLPLAATVEEARASLQLEEVTPERGKAREATVVPIVGNWRRAVHLADKVAVGESCEVHLVDLMKVPRTLPIGTPLPDREAEGQIRLEAAKAVVKEMGLKSFSHVGRVRTESSGLAEFIEQLGADSTVISIDRGHKSDPYVEEAEAMSFFEAATCEVSLVKGTPPERDESKAAKVVVPAVGAWEHALEHACKITSGGQAAIKVIYVITIPRSEPIDSPKPDAEAAASDCAKEALRIGRKYGADVKAVTERVRDPILGLVKLISSNRFDLAVTGVGRETSGDYHIAHATAAALMHEPECETVFLRVGGVERT